MIRESARARRVRLKYTLDNGLLVIVPRGYDTARIPALVNRENAWISKAAAEIEARRQELENEPPALPRSILLRAIGEERSVVYANGRASRALARETPDGVKVSGCPSREEAAAALRRWTARKARAALPPWLIQVSAERGLPFARIAIRSQRTRWASCSARKTISVNQKLLFVPALLVEYVFIHELCHTVELNHSPRFWKLVARHEPDFRRLDRELKGAWRYVPWWACEPGKGELNENHWLRQREARRDPV
ncbi:MAG: M48 family metallopeptidase [Actinobacteria bacterium]|nr:M48 family metallopeptidase [Actinomycetota bacterium]